MNGDDLASQAAREFTLSPPARWFAITCLIVGSALSIGIRISSSADVTSTRITSYDWRILDASGAQIGGAYQRQDTAILGCLATPTCLMWEGGRYRINRATATIPPVVPPMAPATATLSWTAPTAYTDGSALTVTSYRVLYGLSSDSLDKSVTVTTVGTVVTGLTSGIWYFAVRAIDAQGRESDLSNVATKTI